ncbi:MAG: hypothetical protein QXS54_11575, partial [Candidatus Methanomethylicaceae archaeon]
MALAGGRANDRAAGDLVVGTQSGSPKRHQRRNNQIPARVGWSARTPARKYGFSHSQFGQEGVNDGPPQSTLIPPPAPPFSR